MRARSLSMSLSLSLVQKEVDEDANDTNAAMRRRQNYKRVAGEETNIHLLSNSSGKRSQKGKN